MGQQLERRGFLAGAAALAVPKPMLATALPVPSGGTLHFKILRNGTPVGEHHVRFTHSRNCLRVDTNAEMVITVAGIALFHYQCRVSEYWSGGVFTRLDSKVNHNGTPLAVQADQISGGYAICSTKAGDYQYTGNPPMLPLTYWNQAMLRAMILNVETGRHYPAVVNSPGWNKLPTANGGTVVAQRFNVTGKLHLSLWYDQENQWSGLEFHVAGNEVFQKYV
ncbi:MAG: hypothetical protein KGQ26_07255 [Rhodospirillales bacterium]|nr:hypothetical protein [Rhodospirillales bacterium]MDE2318968.1 hypothetical protein [Rhodospirillales bacterium]